MRGGQGAPGGVGERASGGAAAAAGPLLLALTLAPLLPLLAGPRPLLAAARRETEAPPPAPPEKVTRPPRGAPGEVPGRQRPRTLFLPVQAEPQFRLFLYEPPEVLRGDAWKETGRPQPLPVLFFSGEFGWTPLLQDTASRLALKGRYVLAVDTSAYFAQPVPPEAFGRDLETFRTALDKEAGRPQDAPVLGAGFAYGAAMLPYVLGRAGAKGFQGLLLVAPPAEGATVFRAAIMLQMPVPENERFDVAAAIAGLPPLPVVILEGESDAKSGGRGLVRSIRGARKYIPIQGADHQFHNVQEPYLEQVENSLAWLTNPPPAPVQAGRPGAGLSAPGAGRGPAAGPGLGGVARPQPGGPGPGGSAPPGSAPPPAAAPSPAP